ncbi:PREDICTED: F-box/kelch-repeat protein SKIP6-like [Camelina sativa]|uniref:F-box/kelch-repeat protein SKIP6-like n=1 Tax=Camelina sativa TaxID=90675 RepID=A0ABM0TUJ1_CAMSA|nr:PREDICTED: F-box/kelch-repeat protein SKIP6-like [Camelina sativa]
MTGMPPQSKRRKMTTSWSSLPDAVAVSCMARVSRLDHANLSLVSKRHRSLVLSHELCSARSLIGCTEASFYVCLRISPDPNPRWFILLTRTRRLAPIPSNPYQAPESSSFVVVDWGLYVIGGLIKGKPTSDVWFLDCFSKTWDRVPSLKVARASPAASLLNGKIYVFGGCEEFGSNWAEVFNLKTQTWNTLTIREIPHGIHQSVVIEQKVYAVDEEEQSLYFLPSEGTWRKGKKQDSKPGNRNDWCAIGNLLYCRGTRGRILWCEPDELDWKEVKGLEEFQLSLSGSILLCLHSVPTEVKYDISRLCSNSAGNIVIFWNAHLGVPESLELWSAEISMERRQGDEVWGKVVRSGAVYKLEPLSHSYSVKVLYSASVNV